MNEQKGISAILVILAVLLVLVSIGGFYYFQKATTTEVQIQSSNNNTLSKSPLPITTETSLKPVYIGDYDVITKTTADSPCNTDIYLSHCKTDVYLKDKKSGQETKVVTVNDFKINDSRVPEYRNGYIFLIQRTGNDDYPSKDWTDELWVYVDKNHGQKITASPGMNFSASTDGSYVSALFYDNERPAHDSVTIFTKDTNWQSQKYSLNSNECKFNSPPSADAYNLDFEQWDGESSWGVYASEYRIVGCFWSLNAKTGKVAYYPVNNIQSMFALNPQKMVALYNEKPFLGDVDNEKSWEADHPTYSLFLYDLKSGKNQIIDTFPSSFNFNRQVDWKTPTELRYTDPNGEVTYTLTQF